MNKNSAEDVEIWVVYRPEYLRDGFVEIKSWMSDNPNQKFIEKKKDNSNNNKTKPVNKTKKISNKNSLNNTSKANNTK